MRVGDISEDFSLSSWKHVIAFPYDEEDCRRWGLGALVWVKNMVLCIKFKVPVRHLN